jgi:hypothetical protein
VEPPLFPVKLDGAMSARLAAQAYNGSRQLDEIDDPLITGDDGDDNRNSDDAVDLKTEHVSREVIVIPANADSVELQRAIQQVKPNWFHPFF